MSFLLLYSGNRQLLPFTSKQQFNGSMDPGPGDPRASGAVKAAKGAAPRPEWGKRLQQYINPRY